MDSEWLKTQFRANPQKTKADLARALNLDAPAVSKMLAGTRQIKASEYVGMRKFFGLPTDGMRATAARPAGSSYVLQPLQERGMGDHEDSSWVIPARLLAGRTAATPEQIKIFAVQDATMAPEFSAGEHVLVDLSVTHPSPPGTFVLSDGAGYIIRQCEIVPDAQPPQLRISSHRGAAFTVDLRKAALIGRVIAHLEWVE